MFLLVYIWFHLFMGIATSGCPRQPPGKHGSMAIKAPHICHVISYNLQLIWLLYLQGCREVRPRRLYCLCFTASAAWTIGNVPCGFSCSIVGSFPEGLHAQRLYARECLQHLDGSARYSARFSVCSLLHRLLLRLLCGRRACPVANSCSLLRN